MDPPFHGLPLEWELGTRNARPESKNSGREAARPFRRQRWLSVTLDGVRTALLRIRARAIRSFRSSLPRSRNAECLTQPGISTPSRRFIPARKTPPAGASFILAMSRSTELTPRRAPWILGPIQPAFANSFFLAGRTRGSAGTGTRRTLAVNCGSLTRRQLPFSIRGTLTFAAFKAHGGKLIEYHGWGDAAIAPRDSIAFYEQVRKFLSDYPDPRSKEKRRSNPFTGSSWCRACSTAVAAQGAWLRQRRYPDRSKRCRP